MNHPEKKFDGSSFEDSKEESENSLPESGLADEAAAELVAAELVAAELVVPAATDSANSPQAATTNQQQPSAVTKPQEASPIGVNRVNSPQSSDAFQDFELAQHLIPVDDEPGKNFYWVFILIPAMILTMAFIMRTDGGEKVFLPGTSTALPGTCYSKTIFQFDCPGCGLTRCFISCAHGNLVDAWGFNPAGIGLFTLLVLMIPWNFFQMFRLSRGEKAVKVGWINWIYFVLLGWMMIQWMMKTIEGITM